jgi:muramoyltetrapeptide carboxypeptidase LdcA involved in peptidoglycan recycling
VQNTYSGHKTRLLIADNHTSTMHEDLVAALRKFDFPVIYDVDIGHQPPQSAIINGAIAQLNFADGNGPITQAIGA